MFDSQDGGSPAGGAFRITPLAPEQVLALARRLLHRSGGPREYLAKPGGGFANKLASRVDLEEAVWSGSPFAIPVHPSVLALDGDPGPTTSPRQLFETAQRLATMFETEGIEPLVVASGRGIHIFARPVTNLNPWGSLAPGFVLRRGHNNPIRPPGSPHRDGLPTGLILPSSYDEALGRLGSGSEVLASAGVSARIRAAAEHDAHRFRSRSERDAAVALALVNAGGSFADLRRVLLDEDLPASGKVRQILEEQGPARAEAYMRWTWDKEVEYAKRHPPIRDRNAAMVELKAVFTAALAYAPPGVRGGSERRTLLAMIVIGFEAGGPRFNASHRQVAERAGLSLPTVSSSLRHLEQAGWARCISTGQLGRASTWVLRVPRDVEHQHLPGGVRPDVQDLAAALGSDAFTRKGLDTSGLEVFLALEPDEGLEVDDITERVAWSRRTVSTRLRQLAELGLATERGGRWLRSRFPGGIGHALEEAASKLGSEGTVEARRAHHLAQRERHRQELLRSPFAPVIRRGFKPFRPRGER